MGSRNVYDGRALATCQAQNQRPGEVAVQAITVQAYLQALPNQPGGRAVQDAAHRKGARTCDTTLVFNKVGRAPFGQVLQLRTLDLEGRRVAPITPYHGFTYKAFVGRAVLKVAVSTQKQCLLQGLLQIPVG